MTVLEVKNIQKRFEGVVALDHVDFKCEAGRITGLLGANGSGKSTLSKIITGVYRADGGEIFYCGKKAAFSNPAESKKNGISMVFQNLSLVEDLTVWQNIALGCEKKKGLFLDNASAKEKAKALLDELSPGMDIDKYVYQLGPSEMQIVEIAKALIEEPKLLILDEPTASLEIEQVKRLFAYMRKLVKKDIALIFTSHRMKEVMEMCDTVSVFKNGRNVGSLDFEREERDSDAVVRMITGKKKETQVCEKCPRILPEDKILEISDLNYTNRLKHISFNLKRGEILGIGGLSGQGQEELMLALAGNYPKPNVKEMRMDGEELKMKSPADAISKGIFLVPGDRNAEGLFLQHSVYDNFVYPKLAQKKHPLVIPEKKYREEGKETVKKLSVVAKDLNTRVATLSGGNAQKVVIGKWLTFDIKVLLLSDPAKGVDIGAKEDMYRFIQEMTQKDGASVVLYASDAEELIKYCDRVLIMFEGQFVAELCGDDIREDKIYAATMSGVKSAEE
ncbi:sugar ABC transporter ATP-binding protein [Christensenella timonensis]|uniref:sugar ABC transporter ATP-binding protein n=1 Tax=Christensenella timonensis TaxID=1816678 RepID=UPI000832612B|nr:sugar ABC transporter ATP-binding protein [Christensenella timonensis]